MRMWGVNTKQMCRQHLLGEHVEMHMFAGAIKKNKSIEGYIRKGLVNPARLFDRHKEIVTEMENRGMNHKSELSIFPGVILPIINIDTEENEKELKRRCKKCFRENKC